VVLNQKENKQELVNLRFPLLRFQLSPTEYDDPECQFIIIIIIILTNRVKYLIGMYGKLVTVKIKKSLRFQKVS
jgi:hypothetical protein